jgi:hypothetical protein
MAEGLIDNIKLILKTIGLIKEETNEDEEVHEIIEEIHLNNQNEHEIFTKKEVEAGEELFQNQNENKNIIFVQEYYK